MSTALAGDRQFHPSPARHVAEGAEPVRVLHVVPSLSVGGMEQAMLRLIEHSIEKDNRQGHRRRLAHGVCVMQAQNDDMLAECRSIVRTWVLDEHAHTDRPTRHTLAWRLRKAIRCFRPDIVHARSTGVWFDATLATLGCDAVRLLLSFHGRTNLSRPSWRRRLLNRWATGRADAILTMSHDADRMMQQEWKVATHKLHTIHNGVDTQRFRPSRDTNEGIDIRRKLDLGHADHVVLCAANLLPIKGIDVLLRAWRQVCMADRRAHLLIIGDGPERPRLERLMDELHCGRSVKFLGRTKHVEEPMRAANVFVLPSRYEACSNVTLEAMASSLAVIACDVGGMRELITPNRTGWLVPPDSPEYLTKTLLAALLNRSLCQQMGRAAREVAVCKFGVDAWVDQYAAMYRELSSRHQSENVDPLEAMACAE